MVSELATTARGMLGALPLQRLFESRDQVLGVTRAAWQAWVTEGAYNYAAPALVIGEDRSGSLDATCFPQKKPIA